MMGLRYYVLIIVLVVCLQPASAQIWQWSVPVKGEKGVPARAFLWMPPACKKVRAVVLAQNNMEEQSIIEHPEFRKEMSALSFAIIWVSPFFDHLFRFNEGAGETFQAMIDSLVKQSGYNELAYAPVVPMGHSAAASWPYYFAAWAPKRTLCAISVSGQWPYFRDPHFAPDIWSKDQNIDYVPCLETMGEYEAAATWSKEGLKERKEHSLLPLSMLACPAEGHFAASVKKIRYIALFIKKAAQYRLPKVYPLQRAPVLAPIDPTKTGWLMEKWPQAGAVPPAPVNKYTGDRDQAFWFFDAAMVKATEQYESVYRDKKAQLLGYVQDGSIVAQRNTHQQVDLTFQPLPDGITFTIRAVFLDTVPGGHKRTSEWTGLPPGSPIGHAQSGAITIDRISGPFIKIDDTTFRIHFEKGLNEQLTTYQCWFAARHEGDDNYKPAVQQAKMDVPAKNTEGIDQIIHFPAIPNIKKGISRISLQATSNVNLPVHYYVLEGPAEIDGNTVVVRDIPPRSKFPVKVTIVAWQYGSCTGSKIRSAEPVSQQFFITQ